MYNVKRGGATYQFRVHKLPTYSYSQLNNSSTININQVDVYQGNKFLWTMHGVMTEAGYQGHEFTRDVFYTTNPNLGNLYGGRMEWFPPTNPVSASGCAVLPNSEVQSIWGDDYSQENCGNAGSYDVNADNFAGRHIVATDSGFQADGAFKNAINNERTQIYDIRHGIKPALASPQQITPQLTVAAAHIILGVVGAVMFTGGGITSQLCAGTTAPKGQCLGRATRVVLLTAGIIAILGGLILAGAGSVVVAEGVVSATAVVTELISALVSRFVAYYATVSPHLTAAALAGYAQTVRAYLGSVSLGKIAIESERRGEAKTMFLPPLVSRYRCWIEDGLFTASPTMRSNSSRTIVTSGGALMPIFTRSPSTARTDILITPSSIILSPTFRRNTSMCGLL